MFVNKTKLLLCNNDKAQFWLSRLFQNFKRSSGAVEENKLFYWMNVFIFVRVFNVQNFTNNQIQSFC